MGKIPLHRGKDTPRLIFQPAFSIMRKCPKPVCALPEKIGISMPGALSAMVKKESQCLPPRKGRWKKSMSFPRQNPPKTVGPMPAWKAGQRGHTGNHRRSSGRGEAIPAGPLPDGGGRDGKNNGRVGRGAPPDPKQRVLRPGRQMRYGAGYERGRLPGN